MLGHPAPRPTPSQAKLPSIEKGVNAAQKPSSTEDIHRRAAPGLIDLHEGHE
jgi:hypothetical protein